MGFTCPVKIHHLKIRAFNDNTKPSVIKLFVNTKTLGFSECENDDATQEIELKERDFKEDVPLKFVKFQAVKTLTIFFSDNDADKTRVIKFSLFGSAEKETDVFLFLLILFSLKLYFIDEKLEENLLRQ